MALAVVLESGLCFVELLNQDVVQQTRVVFVVHRNERDEELNRC